MKIPGMLILGGAVALVLLLLLSTAVYTVSETEQVIITEFGKPVGEPVREAGLHFKMPFVQEVNRIDRRILEWDGPRTEIATGKKTYIFVDTFGRWRITDPLKFFRRLRDERSALSRLEDILGSETRNAIANHDLIEVIRTTRDRQPEQSDTLDDLDTGIDSGSIGRLHAITKGRQRIEQEIQDAARVKLAEFGIELLDVRFKRINYNPSVVETIYERMISERQQIASLFRSEGEGEAAKIMGKLQRDLAEIESAAYRTVQSVRGQADADATAIYARAYDQSEVARELYAFVKTMETYRTLFGPDTSLVLTTGGDLMQYLDAAAGKPRP
ncbi:MAG: protease modulator HflC [Planctomycetota bacterium]|nr:MAG: protease modulator HflC [Planctomycetota bacterium]